jgi:hypothetical protein
MRNLKLATLSAALVLGIGGAAFAQSGTYAPGAGPRAGEPIERGVPGGTLDRGPTGTIVDPGQTGPGGGPIGGREEIRKERELRDGATPDTIPR